MATASYRLLPVVTLKGEVEDEEAEELVAKCPLNVFDIEDMPDGYKSAKVKSVGAFCGTNREFSFCALKGGGFLSFGLPSRAAIVATSAIFIVIAYIQLSWNSTRYLHTDFNTKVYIIRVKL